MRIALISDIHGNLAALEAVAADIRRRGADTVVNLGDNLSGPLLPLETAQYLMASGWLSLAGNHERQILDHDARGGGFSDGYARAQLGARELAWLHTLRPSHQFADDVLLCHATPQSDCTYLLESVHHGVLGLARADEIHERLAGESAPMIACGHTHVPRAVRLATGQLIVNPGSVGRQAFSDDHVPAHVMEMGSPDARYAIIEHTQAGWRAALYAVPYDHASMAQLARQRRRPEWEAALMRGYVL